MKAGALSLLLQFIPVYCFWLVLSGRFQPFYLITGAITCLLVCYFNIEMFTDFRPTGKTGRLSITTALKAGWHFLAYIPWLALQVFRDNLQVAYMVIHPRMPIDPGAIIFNTGYKRPLSQVILANSITLSPGTMTVMLEDNHYLVHMLLPASCGNLVNGKTQNKVARIFSEGPEPVPQVEWHYSFKELS